ncbi:unnamed protein product [Paramecium primaurelia]|uniref:Transmembrane protein n=1 Tax=Paramecium primaurelia TaxID=5886 RepID=A0A8S1L519_PARPR|nr:unnamed protein product [Paramecium primaurelia]
MKTDQGQRNICYIKIRLQKQFKFMKIDITILLILVSITNEESQEFITGCQIAQNPCLKKCEEGYQLCEDNNNIRCEYGYFKLNIKNENYCVRCPLSNVDEMMYLCMDCRENSETWQNQRQCTYNYAITDGDKYGAFRKIKILETQIFNIHEVLSEGVKNSYETELCVGCLAFCDEQYNDDEEEECNILSDQDDIIHIGVICSDGYYFENNLCITCPFDKCKSCDNKACFECFDGYTIDYTQKCIPCFQGCAKCEYYNGIICLECIKEQDNYLVLIQGGLDCSQCDYQCLRCQVIYVNGIEQKRCTQCKTGYIVNNQGSQCEYQQNNNCEIGYYEYSKDGINKLQTYNLDFEIVVDYSSKQKCYKCKSGYKLTDGQVCTIYIDPNCNTLDQDKNLCLECKDNKVLQYENGITLSNSCLTDQYCNKKIKYCIQCISYNINSIQQYQCIKCQKGYYPDIFTNLCIQCQSRCDECWQYTNSYNITSYLQLQLAGINYDQFKQDLELIKIEKLNDPLCSICQLGFNLYNNQCKGCTDSCVPESFQEYNSECIYLDDTAYCAKCPIPSLQQSLITDNSECNECPNNCIACRERMQDEINRVNPFFNPDFEQFKKYSNFCYKTIQPQINQKIYIDSFFGVPITCVNDPNSKGCDKKIVKTFNVYCGDKNDILQANEIQLKDVYKKQKNKIVTLYLQGLENAQIYNEYNQLTINQIDININFISDNNGICNFDKPIQIKSNFQKNIFTLQKLSIIINGKNSIFKQNGRMILLDSSYVQISNINFKDKTSSIFGLEILGKKTMLTMINCKIVKDNVASSFNIVLQNTIFLKLLQVEFEKLKNENFLKQTSTNSFQEQGQYIFEDVHVKNSEINDILITINQIGANNILQINSLKFSNTNITNTAVFSDLITTPSYNVIINDLKLIKCTITNGSIFNLALVKSFQAQNLESILTLYQKWSNFIISTTFTIEKMFCYHSLFTNHSELIASNNQIYNSDQKSSILLFTFKLITFRNNICQNINCLIILSTPLNNYGISSNIQIEQLIIQELQIQSISQKNIEKVSSALISLQNVGNITMNELTIKNTQGLSIFFIGQSQSIEINNVYYYLEISNDLLYEYDEQIIENFEIDPNLSNYIMVTNPVNNLLPNSPDCANRKRTAYQFNSYLIYIEGFQGSIVMDNIEIFNLLFIDRSAIFIKSYQNLLQMQMETILLQNLSFDNNRLASTLNGEDMSLIIIDSQQIQNITIINAQYNENHLHQITDSQTSQTPALILIISPNSILNLLNSYFNYNRISKSTNGLIWIKVDQFILNNCYFKNTNILDIQWLDYLEEQQLTKSDPQTTFINLKQYFYILSKGSNLYIIGKFIYIDNIQIIESYGQSAAGIFLELLDGIVIIKQSNFKNIQSSLQQIDNTEGGCLTINSDSSQMQLELYSVIMTNCTARIRGGCIHLYPTKFKQSILLKDSQFQLCQSLGYSFFSNPYLESTDQPIIEFLNIYVEDNNYNNFIQNLPDLSLLEQLQLTKNSGIYYQHTGKLIIRNSIFTNIKYLSIIKAIAMTDIFISQCVFTKNILFLMPLLDLQMTPTVSNQIQIIASEFIDNWSTNINPIVNKCDGYIRKGLNSTLDQQTCDQIMYIIDFQNFVNQDQIIWNSDEYLEYYNYLTEQDKYGSIYSYNFYYAKIIQIVQRFNSTPNNNLINCILQNMLNLTLEANQDITTSIITITNLFSNSQLKFEKISIISNRCLRCYGGLIQILGVNIGIQKDTKLFLTHINCKDNLIGYYGCLLIQQSQTINTFIPNQNLIDLNVTQFSNRLLQLNQEQTVQIDLSIFSSNRASIGTGISLLGLNALIKNSIFSDNSASLVGAGVYYMNIGGDLETSLYVYNLSFQSNKAQVGAAFYLINKELANVNSLLIKFEYNYATIQANNIHENSRRQTLQMNEDSYYQIQVYLNLSGDENLDGNIDSINNIIRENITFDYHMIGNYPEKTNLLILPSGQSINTYEYFFEDTQEYIPYEWIFRVINLNRFNEPVVNDEDGDKCYIFGRIQKFQNYSESISFTNNFTIPNEMHYNKNLKGYVLDDMQLSFDPYFDKDFYLELKIKCDKMAIPIYANPPDSKILGYNKKYELILNVRTFPCQKGEVYQLGRCIPCSPKLNQYSVTIGSVLCSQFNSDYMIAIKKSSIQLKPGYWRPDYNNDQSLYCENLDSNCNGGWVPGNPSCYTGHIGALCESCDLYQIYNYESYTQTSSYKCAKCGPTMQLNYIVLVVTSIISFISMVLAVKGSYESSMQFIIEEIFDIWGVLLKSSESNLAVLMKVLTNYFQIIQFIASFQISIPDLLKQTTKIGGNPTESTTTAMDCLFITMSDLDILYFRMVWAFIQPLIYLIGFYIIYFVGIATKRFPYKINIITTALIYQFLYLQPTYVEGFIVLASSRTISGIPYVQRDVAYKYDSAVHQYYLLRFIMPMLIIWVLLLPLLFMFLVYKNRATINTKQTKLIYGFFYLEYQLNSYLWEFVKLFQKEFMVIILVYYEDQVTVKGLLLVVIMFLYGFYQIQISPYSNKRLNMIDRYSTIILSISLAMGVLLKSCQDSQFGYLVIIVSILLILINVPFLLTIIYYIFEGYIIKLSPILDKIRDFLNQKYPNLSKTYPWLRPYLINKAQMTIRVKAYWDILRNAVKDTNQFCKEHDLKFKKVFPPYAKIEENEGNTFVNISIETKPNLIEDKQPLIIQDSFIHINQDNSQNQLPSAMRTQNMQTNGVVQLGQFFTSSFMINESQEPIPITGQGFEQWPDQTQYQGLIVNDILYFRMVWAFIQPLIYLIGFYIIYFVGIATKRFPYKINIITTALIYQFLYLQPTYVEGFIVLASSRTISGIPYVQRDVAYKYDSAVHQYYLLRFIMPMLIIWVLLLPLLFMFLVYKNRATINTKQTKLIYGFFYLEYQLNSYLWEFVKLFQKEFMVIILVYYEDQVTVKGLLLVVIMFLYGFYQIQISPYSNKRLNMIDRYSTIILSISLAMGVLLKSCQDSQFGYLVIIVSILLILINVPFLLTIIYYIFEGYIIKLSPILDKIRDFLNQKYPNLSKTYPWLRPYLINKAQMTIRVKAYWDILRNAVKDTNQFCKEHDLKFKKVFPPYAKIEENEGNTFVNISIETKPNLIEDKQPLIIQDSFIHINQDNSQNQLPSAMRTQNMQTNGVVQLGQFFTSSFMINESQEPIPITGQGFEQWPDQTQYQGLIVNGKKQGKGILLWPFKENEKQQEQYEGEFYNNLFDGYGVYKWSDGKVYEGGWKEGKRHGYGKYQGINQQYEGEFQNDQYQGYGNLNIGDKLISGQFVKGKMDGEMNVIIGKKKRRGIWRDGVFEKWIN